MDESLGPVAISFRRQKIVNEEGVSQSNVSSVGSSGGGGGSQRDQHFYRLIIRTSELATLRGTVLEDAIPSLKPPGPKGFPLREVLDMVTPEVQLGCLRLAIPGSTTEQQLLKLDQQGLSNHYKVGILYCQANQSTEEEMYNNETAGPAFDEFLDLIGQRVRLRGFDKYKAGLDNKMDSTGLYSVYSQYHGCEVMVRFLPKCFPSFTHSSISHENDCDTHSYHHNNNNNDRRAIISFVYFDTVTRFDLLFSLCDWV